jgi:hypothetical protein
MSFRCLVASNRDPWADCPASKGGGAAIAERKLAFPSAIYCGRKCKVLIRQNCQPRFGLIIA